MGPVGEEGELGQLGIRVSEATSFLLQNARVNVIRQCIFIALTEPNGVNNLNLGSHALNVFVSGYSIIQAMLCLLLDIMTSGAAFYLSETHEICHAFSQLVFHPKINHKFHSHYCSVEKM